MLDTRVKFALENFIAENYFLKMQRNSETGGIRGTISIITASGPLEIILTSDEICHTALSINARESALLANSTARQYKI